MSTHTMHMYLSMWVEKEEEGGILALLCGAGAVTSSRREIFENDEHNQAWSKKKENRIERRIKRK